jgi:hypothetical protein
MHPGCRIEAVYLCRDLVDFRKSIDGLPAIVCQWEPKFPHWGVLGSY